LKKIISKYTYQVISRARRAEIGLSLNLNRRTTENKDKVTYRLVD